ncbi:MULTISPECIES: copper resistance CopC family protein [unclassified Microbacterium]|uniref:copper resistance CopC family protein n=1 Tax=unclassified Microbacterium TaxID=2609290 RepID=UPI001605413F|nr:MULTISPECIES: copper resistance CopC family protein [unclassified Microbacterium]QNA92934.1 copper resistance protein CopC [Microbacterium sp. Se63.02b]QYM63093.1 copper resistance protein CopC [Microbacterium sp. Se5.02b]
MKTKALRHPAAPIALAATLLAAFFVLLSPLPASAHDALVSSSPSADEVIETVPTDLTLTFSAKLIEGEGATEVVVTAPDGTSVADGAATVEGAIVTQPLTAKGPAGEYHVIWKVVSSDGHPTSGEYSFTVTVGDSGTASPTAAPTSAAPTPEQSATTEPSTAPTATTAPDPEDADGGSAWIWIVSILGVLVAAGAGTWLALRGRGGRSATDSDTPSER